MKPFQIIKSHNHDHFWCENNIVYESYNTIRGLRFRQLIELNFKYPDKELLTETMVTFLNNIFKNNKGMKHRNYAIMVEENSHYPISYTIKQDGTKVIENKMLKVGDMTENQIKELFFLGYFEEKPTQEEVDEYLDYINKKRKRSNVL